MVSGWLSFFRGFEGTLLHMAVLSVHRTHHATSRGLCFRSRDLKFEGKRTIGQPLYFCIRPSSKLMCCRTISLGNEILALMQTYLFLLLMSSVKFSIYQTNASTCRYCKEGTVLVLSFCITAADFPVLSVNICEHSWNLEASGLQMTNLF